VKNWSEVEGEGPPSRSWGRGNNPKIANTCQLPSIMLQYDRESTSRVSGRKSAQGTDQRTLCKMISVS
jgi:hypothetical protein